MRMKNANPFTGYRQVATGRLYLPRRKIIEWVRSKRLSPSQLGNYVILLVSADWHQSCDRTGLIRFTDFQLSSIWSLSPSAFSKMRRKLTKSGLLSYKNECTRINDFHFFTSEGSNQFTGRLSDNDLSMLFPSLDKERTRNEKLHQVDDTALQSNDNCHQKEANNNSASIVSFKENFNKQRSRLVVRQELRKKEEYEKIYQSGDYQSLTVDDMKLIDEDATETVDVRPDEQEQNAVDAFFGGDWENYKSHLITT